MTRNSYQSLSHSQRKSVSSSACFERDLSLYFSMNFYIEAHQYRRCEQFRELTIWKHWLLLTLIPGKGSCTVWKRGSTKQWSLWVTKIIKFLLVAKGPKFQGFGLGSLFARSETETCPHGRLATWSCLAMPRPQPCPHSQQLNPEGGWNSLGDNREHLWN